MSNHQYLLAFGHNIRKSPLFKCKGLKTAVAALLTVASTGSLRPCSSRLAVTLREKQLSLKVSSTVVDEADIKSCYSVNLHLPEVQNAVFARPRAGP